MFAVGLLNVWVVLLLFLSETSHAGQQTTVVMQRTCVNNTGGVVLEVLKTGKEEECLRLNGGQSIRASCDLGVFLLFRDSTTCQGQASISQIGVCEGERFFECAEIAPPYVEFSAIPLDTLGACVAEGERNEILHGVAFLDCFGKARSRRLNTTHVELITFEEGDCAGQVVQNLTLPLNQCANVTAIDGSNLTIFTAFVDANAGCFSADMTVISQSGLSTRMDTVQIGDYVMVSERGEFEPVLYFSRHWTKHGKRGDVGFPISFYQLQTSAGPMLQLTGNHLVMVFRNNTKILVPANKVRAGDSVFNESGSLLRITDVGTIVRSDGAFMPLTRSTSIIVNGVLASCLVQQGSLKNLAVHLLLELLNVLFHLLPLRMYMAMVSGMDWTMGIAEFAPSALFDLANQVTALK